jgi:site-specific recombinase XerD
LIAAGIDDMTLQSVIGHSDVRTTKNVYGHLLPNALDAVRARLDAFLSWSSQGPQVHGSERF